MSQRLVFATASLLAVPLLAACSITMEGCCSFAQHQGSGVSATETRTVEPFSEIRVVGSADVRAQVGPERSVKVTCDDNLLEHVRTQVEGDALVVDLESGSYDFEVPLLVEVTTPELSAVEVAGSGDVWIEGLHGPRFSAEVAGSGDVSATGSAEAVDVEIAGSGDIDLSGVEAKRASVEIAGSGDVQVRATEAIDIDIAGSGNVRYFGQPPKVRTSIAGSGEVEPADGGSR